MEKRQVELIEVKEAPLGAPVRRVSWMSDSQSTVSASPAADAFRPDDVKILLPEKSASRLTSILPVCAVHVASARSRHWQDM